MENLDKEDTTQMDKHGSVYYYLCVFVPTFTIMTLLLGFVYCSESNYAFESRSCEEIFFMDSFSETLTDYLNRAVLDVLLLSTDKEVVKIFDAPGEEERIDLAGGVALFCKLKPFCFKVRVIDKSGMELIQIEKRGDVLSLLPENLLQNKKGRYYFKESMALDEGGIYVSPMDLNVEHRKIEVPWIPTIRIGSPIFDADGVKRGLIVLNLSGEVLLNKLTRLTFASEVEDVILNSDGYQRYGGKRQDHFAFIFEDKREQHFGGLYHDLWNVISDGRAGQIDSGHT